MQFHAIEITYIYHFYSHTYETSTLLVDDIKLRLKVKASIMGYGIGGRQRVFAQKFL